MFSILCILDIISIFFINKYAHLFGVQQRFTYINLCPIMLNLDLNVNYRLVYNKYQYCSVLVMILNPYRIVRYGYQSMRYNFLGIQNQKVDEIKLLTTAGRFSTLKIY